MLVFILLVPLVPIKTIATIVEEKSMLVLEDIDINTPEGEIVGTIKEGTILYTRPNNDDELWIQWSDTNISIPKRFFEELSADAEAIDYSTFNNSANKPFEVSEDGINVYDSEHKETIIANLKGPSIHQVVENDNGVQIIIGNRVGYIETATDSVLGKENESEIFSDDEKISSEVVDNELVSEDSLNIDTKTTSQADEVLDFDIKKESSKSIGNDEKQEIYSFSDNDRYFEAIYEKVPVYDNSSKTLKLVGYLQKGQVYPRLRDYGNWHEIQFGSKYGYVRERDTKPAAGSSLKNLNTNYKNSSRTFKAISDLNVYDNSNGYLDPYATIVNGEDYPIVSDYGNWYRVLVSGRVGYVRKSEVTTTFLSTDKYFKVMDDNLPVYDNRSGKLVQVGSLGKGQVFPRVRAYGNWHRINFGGYYGYVRVTGTVPDTGKSINNLNANYHHSKTYITTTKDAVVYDNTSGKLVPFATISKGKKFPIVNGSGNWYRILLSDRVGYIRQADTQLEFTSTTKYFKVNEDRVPIYDNRTGKLVQVGELNKGDVYPRIRDYGNWHRIQFSSYYGYVQKSLTSPISTTSLKNINKTYKNTNRNVKVIKDTIVYDNTSGKLVPFASIKKGTEYAVASDYGNWYRIILSDRIGYISKKDTLQQFVTTDKYLEITADESIIYDNRSGSLKPVGKLLQGAKVTRIRDYGNWHRIQFGDIYGYIKKEETQPLQKIDYTNTKYKNSKEYFYTTANITVYDNTTNSKRLTPFATLLPEQKYPIVGHYGNWYRVLLSDKVGYVRKKDVMPVMTWPENKEDIVSLVENQSSKLHISRIDQFFHGGVNSDYLKAANDMLNGVYAIPPYGTFTFKNGINWSENNSYTRSYLYSLHSHFFLNDLLNAYEDTKDKRYLLKVNEIIRDWVANNSYDSHKKTIAWHDDATARRTVTWIRYLDLAKNVLPNSDLTFILENIIEHADLLATDEFHTTNTNHGMFQDESLLVVSEYLPMLDKSSKYSEIAKKRLKDYFEFIVSDDGVHKEHSPSYHQIIASNLGQYTEYFRMKNDIGTYKEFLSIYDHMAVYFTHVIKPDGTLPLVGDTFPNHKPSNNIWTDNKFYQYALSKGAKGEVPKETNMVFPDGGYAVFRDSWESGQVGTYIHFTAAYHAKYHKHADDLSVWIYSGGDLVTEAGPNGYDYDSKYTQYGYSSFSHNTLVVDDESLAIFPKHDYQYDKTKITDYNVNTSSPSVTGINQRYEGVTHTRNLQYQKQQNKIVVKDNVKSQNKHNYKVLWHLAEGVSPKINGNNVDLYRDEKKVATLSMASKQKFTIKNVNGQQKPYLLGWRLNGVNNPSPSNTLVVELNGSNTEVVSTFHLYQ